MVFCGGFRSHIGFRCGVWFRAGKYASPTCPKPSFFCRCPLEAGSTATVYQHIPPDAHHHSIEFRVFL